MKTRTCFRRVSPLLLLAAIATVAQARSEPQPTDRFELYFELKLLLRDRVAMRRIALDQWAGGRLLMGAESLPGGATRLKLVRPLEDPWTFRWYPTKGEIKLGAAIAVEEPAGDPYGALAGLLEPSVRARYGLWWDADRVAPTVPAAPAWQARADRFWAARHRSEQKDPLPETPVYPFHILGDPAGRFLVTIGPAGALDGESVTDRMSEPWLTDGWAGWLSGNRREGYGYWGGERPRWEPATYQALSRALLLLAWSPFGGDDTVHRVSAGDLPAAAAAVIAALQPRFGRRIAWKSDETTLQFSVDSGSTPLLLRTGDTGDRPLPGERGISYRAWRHTRRDEISGRILADEVQFWLAHENERTMKLWIRVGYRPAPGDLEPSSAIEKQE